MQERPGQEVHLECISGYVETLRAKRLKRERKVERVKDKARADKLKTKREWMAEAQTAVNRYVRLRDAHKGCVSCDLGPYWDGQWHASHLRSVGAASAVRYHLWNIHKSCSACNNHKSGNIGEYLPRVSARIGGTKVDWLYTQNQRTVYTVDYLKRLKAVFTKKAKRLEARL